MGIKMKDPTTFAVMMTDCCSSSCRICCYGCSPKGSQLLDEKIVKNYIDQAAESGFIETFAFTGGEPMMHHKLLKDYVDYAYKRGLNVTLRTNGFWAQNYDKGYELMAELYEAGLRWVLLSIDKFHLEFVPLEAMKNAIKILKRLGIAIAASCMELKYDVSADHIWTSLRPEIYGVKLMAYPVFAVGAARAIIKDEQYIRLVKTRMARCPFLNDENDMIIFIDGKVIPCCSQFSNMIPFLNMGNYKKITLAEAVERRNQNDFINVLLSEGFAWFIERAEKWGYSFSEYYTSACELCYDIFGDSDLYEKFKPLVEAEARRIRLAKRFGAALAGIK